MPAAADDWQAQAGDLGPRKPLRLLKTAPRAGPSLTTDAAHKHQGRRGLVYIGVLRPHATAASEGCQWRQWRQTPISMLPSRDKEPATCQVETPIYHLPGQLGTQ